jgi:hypothetical protein
VATASEDGTARIWDAAQGRETATLAACERPVRLLAFSPAARLLATSGDERTVRIWQDRRLVRLLAGRDDYNHFPFVSMDFSPDGKLAAVGSADDTLSLWDVTTGREIKPRLPQEQTVVCVAFAPDGQVVAGGSFSGTVKVWEIGSGKELLTLKGGERVATAIAFGPSGRQLAAGTGDGSVRVWDARTGALFADLAGHQGPVSTLAFAPAGGHPPQRVVLATGGEDGTIRLWDAADWKRKPEILSARLGSVTQLAFSPDGKTLATAHSRDAITLWNVALRKEVAILRSDEFELTRVAFSPDGETLAAGSVTGKVRFWETAPAEAIAAREAKARAQLARLDAEAPARMALLEAEERARVYLEINGSAAARTSNDGGAFRFDIGKVDGTEWHVQAYRVRTDLREGATYTLRFRARADRPLRIGVGLNQGEPPWHAASFSPAGGVSLATGWRTYQYAFRAKDLGSRRGNRVPVFTLGQQVGTVWLADITLTER